MTEEHTPPAAFYVKDCVLAPIATGIKAQTLSEFRDRLAVIPAECIYYHFWSQSLDASLPPGSFYNEFSHWAHYALHDDFLAERLALLDPSEYENLEKLRGDLIEIVENRLDEQDGNTTGVHADAFHFIRSKIVVFNTPYKMDHPKDLVKTIPAISRSSIFYHFIDARRRHIVSHDDFSSWLQGFHGEYDNLVDKLKQIDPYFISLADLHHKINLLMTDYFIKEN